MASTVCVPGQILSTIQKHLSGPGTHVHETNILASIIGTSLITPAQSRSTKPTISVPRQATTTANTPSLPKVGSHVLCRVTRLRQRELHASILAIISPATSPPSPSSIVPYTHITTEDLQFQAILRKEDIRTHADANATIPQSYRVGDIILAQVISLGDERNYYVSTAGNEFGVIVATSEADNAMVPVSWREMKDVVTGSGEARKVAKPS